MDWKTLFQTVLGSTRDDWHVEHCWGGSGPSYRDSFVFNSVYQRQPNVLTVQSHLTVAALKSNLSITLGFGLEHLNNYVATWANGFSDPKASSSYVDIFFNSALVFRTLGVSVDGGRAMLPAAPNGSLDVPGKYRDFIRLVDSMSTATSDFDRYFVDSKLNATTAPWPD